LLTLQTGIKSDGIERGCGSEGKGGEERKGGRGQKGNERVERVKNRGKGRGRKVEQRDRRREYTVGAVKTETSEQMNFKELNVFFKKLIIHQISEQAGSVYSTQASQ